MIVNIIGVGVDYMTGLVSYTYVSNPKPYVSWLLIHPNLSSLD